MWGDRDVKPLWCYLPLTARQRGVVCSISGVSPTSTWGCVLSGKVHGTQRVLVDLYGLGQGLVVTPIALAWCMASFGTESAKFKKIYKNSKMLTLSGVLINKHFMRFGLPEYMHTHVQKGGKHWKWLREFTCHALCPPSDSEPGKPPNGHSRLVLGWKLTGCSAHRCGKAGRWEPAVHPKRSGCHPRAHGSETACWCPDRRETKYRRCFCENCLPY